MKIAILMAALNEAQTLPALLEKIPSDMEVFIVDDGSTDGTRQVALRYGAKVIKNPINMGQGHAFITGIKGILRFWTPPRDQEGCIVFLDADGQHDPAQIPLFVERMKKTGADIIVGSRILGENYAGAPFFRKTFLPHFTWMINQLSGYEMTDAMCGFRAFNVRALSRVEHILDAMIEPQYLAAEMFLRFARAGLRVEEVPIVMTARASGLSYKGLVRYGFGILKAVARVLLDRSYRSMGEQIMKFTSITLLFAAFSLGMIYLIALRVKQERAGIRSSLVWLSLWFSIGFFSLFPELLNWAARFAQMESRIIFVLLFAVFVLFAFMFSVTTRLDRQQRQIEKLVQEIALANFALEQQPPPQNEPVETDAVLAPKDQ